MATTGTISFYPRAATAAGETSIYFRHTYKKSNFERSTGVIIPVTAWDATRRRLVKSHPSTPEWTERLQQVETILRKASRNLQQHGLEPTKENMRVEYANVLGIEQRVAEELPRLKAAVENRLDRMEAELVDLLLQVDRKREQIRRWHQLNGTYSGFANSMVTY